MRMLRGYYAKLLEILGGITKPRFSRFPCYLQTLMADVDEILPPSVPHETQYSPRPSRKAGSGSRNVAFSERSQK
jgi:hypothetical protein